MKLLRRIAAASLMFSLATAFSAVAPPAQRQQTSEVAQKFKITWELDVEERIRRSLEEGHYLPGKMPYLVAVVGIPGSGKSTGAEILADRLGGECMHMPFDGYHYSLCTLECLPESEGLVYRRGAPETFDPHCLIRDLERIRHGSERFVPLPGFCHAEGDPKVGAHLFDRQKHNVVVCEGLYLLHDQDGWESLKDMFDLSVFVDAPVDVCMERLKFRNRMIPGYTPEEIDIRVDAVDRINSMIVDASKYRADIVVKSAAHE